jgi:hypothetical protein
MAWINGSSRKNASVKPAAPSADAIRRVSAVMKDCWVMTSSSR